MYRILLVDDEPIMLKALEQMVKNANRDLQVVATARTGREAIEKVNLFRPDILVTDIKMPGINGLEAIRQIKSLTPDIHCIILSAFDYFDYATEAVGLGVDDYLLKPVKDSIFQASLARALENVRDRRVKLSEDLKLRESLELMRPILEAGFFHALRSYEETPHDLTTYSRLINGDAYGGYAISFSFTDSNTDINRSDVRRSVDNQMAYTTFLNGLTSLNPNLIATIVGNRLFAFVFVRDYLDPYDQKLQAELLCQTILNKNEHLPFYISVGIGKHYTDLTSCKISYAESLQALQQSQKHKHQNHFLHFHDLQSIDGLQMQHNQWQEDQVFSEVALGRTDSALFAFDEWFKEAQVQCHNSFDTLRGQLIAFLIGFGRFRNALNSSFYTDLSTLLKCETPEALRYTAHRMLINLCHLIPSLKQKQINSLIQKADAYMEKHFDQDLSLEEISKVVNLSPFYFSRFYKDETGVNYINRLIDIRIEKSKALLLETDLPIKDLSVRVGYIDSNYFSKLFKKMTGYTPTEFKDSFRK